MVLFMITYSMKYTMSKSIRVSEAFHAYLKSQNRDGETMEETLRRLTDAPTRDSLASRISSNVYAE